MTRPRLLDLYSGAGGAAMGYHRAGFNVVGVDIRPMPRYPFEFHQADALEFLAAHGHEFDAIHASPPCQAYSLLAFAPNRNMDNYEKTVPEVRRALILSSKPYVIENVPGAPLENRVILCGTMFGLSTHKHRAFECRPPVWFAPAGCRRDLRVKAKGQGRKLALYKREGMITVAGHTFSLPAGRKAMDIDWMTRDELAEAIPPAYTEYIGRHLLAVLGVP